MNPPREHIFVNATDAERTYSDAQLAADRATARAIKANHPSTQRRRLEPVPDLFDTPSTLPVLHTHVTGIGAAAARLRLLVDQRDRGQG